MNQVFLMRTPSEIFQQFSTLDQLESWLTNNNYRLHIDPFLFDTDRSTRVSPEEPIFFGKILGTFLSLQKKEYFLYVVETSTDISKLKSKLEMLMVSLTGFFRL